LPKKSMEPKYQNKQWLETQYVALDKTTGGIASEIGVSRETIRTWLHKHNIPVGDKGPTKGTSMTQYEEMKNEAWLQEEYVENKRSAEDIAGEVGCAQQTVLNALERYDIERRESGNKMNSTMGSQVDTRLSNKDWLVTQLLDKDRSMYEIGNQLGATTPAVQYWVDKLGVEYEPDSTFGVRDKRFQNDPKWNERRQERLNRDNHLCQDCGMEQEDCSRSLDVHHLRAKDEFVQDDGSVNWEEANNPKNLISLCRSCHIKRHTN